jgi:hypothetical protein
MSGRARESFGQTSAMRGICSEAANDDLVPGDTGTKIEHVTDQMKRDVRKNSLTSQSVFV